jgi:hypothetical protein
MKEAFARLIHKAQADLQVRDDVDPVELLGVVAALPAGLRCSMLETEDDYR